MEENPIATYKSNYPLIYPDRMHVYENEVEVKRIVGILKGLDTQRIRYDQIAQVVVSSGAVWARLTLESTGGGSVIVDNLKKDQAQEAAALTRERVHRTGSPANTPSSPAPDVPAQIRELARLKEEGAITELEFEAKKRDLLERM